MQYMSFDSMFFQEMSRTVCCENSETHAFQSLRRTQEVHLVLQTSDTEQDIFFRNFKSYGNHSLQKSFLYIFTETSNLTGRSHLDSKNGIGAFQSREAELRNFYSHMIEIKSSIVTFLESLSSFAEHGTRCDFYEVISCNF